MPTPTQAEMAAARGLGHLRRSCSACRGLCCAAAPNSSPKVRGNSPERRAGACGEEWLRRSGLGWGAGRAERGGGSGVGGADPERSEWPRR